ncbi:MAG: FAD synthetase family protein, partial [Clostridia bacterium]
MIETVFKEKLNKKICIALGFFDCMHTGHRELLSCAMEKAKRNNALTAVFTFCNNHFNALHIDNKLLYTYEERKLIFESLGVDVCVYAKFDETFRDKTSDEFLKDIFAYDLAGIVCGYDYTYGSDKATADKLSAECKKRSIPFVMVKEVSDNGVKISSTLIKKYISENNITKANEFL